MSRDQVEDFYKAIEDGLSIKDSCAIAGVSTAWYYDNKKDPNFSDGVELALAKCKQKYLAPIEDAAIKQKDWKAAAWFLERKFKEDFGVKVFNEIVDATPEAKDEVVKAVKKFLEELKNEPADRSC